MPLWLTKIGHGFQAMGTWLKGNWVLLLLGLSLVFTVLFAKKKSDNYALLMKEFMDQQTQNAKELAELRKIQQEQIAKQQEIDRRYREVIAKIEKDYQDQIRSLTTAKQQELRQIIERNGDDPGAMASEINSLLGIPLYTLPSQG